MRWACIRALTVTPGFGDNTDFGGTLHGSFTAHRHVDPLTGEMHGICYDVTRRGSIRHVVVTPEGRVRREVKIPVKHGPMIHDCAITQRFAIVLDLPVTFSLLAGISGRTFPYRWRQSHAARVGLLPREGDARDIIWCPIDPCYVFHAINSYDASDGTVVLDVIVRDRMFSRIKAGPDSQASGVERWIVDPVTQAVERIVIDAGARTTDLAILDARNFEAAPRASVRIPHIVPPGFHGNWLQNG